MCNTTQKELAEKLGVSEVTLSRASNGNTSLSLLDKIACTLGIEISELFAPSNSVQGCIIVSLYWKDHNPPHIHFSYGDYECSISVLDRVVDGQAPVKVIAKVNEWIDLHEAEILTLWEKAQKGEKLNKIEPLK